MFPQPNILGLGNILSNTPMKIVEAGKLNSLPNDLMASAVDDIYDLEDLPPCDLSPKDVVKVPVKTKKIRNSKNKKKES